MEKKLFTSSLSITRKNGLSVFPSNEFAAPVIIVGEVNGQERFHPASVDGPDIVASGIWCYGNSHSHSHHFANTFFWAAAFDDCG